MPEKLKKRRERLAKAAQTSQVRTEVGGAPRKRGWRSRRVSRQAKTVFTTQLATLQDAGLPILRSLRVLEGQLHDGPMKGTVETLAEDVETGASLSEAVAKHPAVFDDLYVNMVRAGEASGALSTIFRRLAEFMEKSEALRQKIRGAMIYPIFIVVFATLIMMFIMTYVVPKFETTFAALGGRLPAMTRLLIDASRWISTYWYVILMVPFFFWGVLHLVGRSYGGRRFLDRVKFKIPIFGLIALKAHVARFTRTLGTLNNSGVPLMQSLEIVGDAAGNLVVKEAVESVREAVREGEPMARPMGETGLFDDIVVNMVDVGEETGELDRMLMRIADNYELEVDTKISGMVQVLEPILIVVMGVIVGFIVVALFLPLLEMQSLIGGGGR